MSDSNWIKLNRKLFEKPIWLNSTPEQKVILITLLGMVNHTETQWEWEGQQYTCKPGQKVTSLENIREKCGKGITIQNVRTAINRFEKLQFLTNQSTKTGRLITIVNWEKYQVIDKDANKDINKDITKTSQRPNKDLTTNKNDKECKNDKEYISPLTPLIETLPPDLQESVWEFVEHRKQIKAPMSELAVKKMLNKLNDLSGGDTGKCIAILNQSIINGWKGIFQLDEKKNKTGNKFLELLAKEQNNDESRND